jgi:hypothetical protein
VSPLERLDGHQALREARALLEDVSLLLQEEQRAIRRFDLDQVTALAARKQQLLGRLEALASKAPAKTEGPKQGARLEVQVLRDAVAKATERMRALAEANALLFGDIVSAMTERLGGATSGGPTYNGRARPVFARGSAVRRSI